MNNYEGIFILKPDLKEEQVKTTHKVISEIVVKNGGSITKEEAGERGSWPIPSISSKRGITLSSISARRQRPFAKSEAAYKLNGDIRGGNDHEEVSSSKETVWRA